MTTRTEELLAEGVITRLDVMVEETSATVAGLTSSCQADRLEDMLVEVHDTGTRPVEETGFAELLTELHAISVRNAEVPTSWTSAAIARPNCWSSWSRI